MTPNLDYFLHSAGPAAHPTMILGWILTGICIAVCILIAILLTIAILRRRPALSAQTLHGGDGGLRWVYTASIISTVILAAIGAYALVILNNAETPPRAPAMTITVTGYQYWWKAVYDDGTETANEIHIPTGEPVLIKLASADVIHAFWVPQLAGKTQMIPGQINRQWLQADAPGAYHGQCTQYCGLQHAHMAFDIVAQTPDDFRQWLAAQHHPAQPPNTAGARIFIRDCAACHTVRGTNANGAHGPDLTHLESRRQIAAGLMDNTPENLADWIARPQELKPGVRMPDFALSAPEKTALMAYLMTLK